MRVVIDDKPSEPLTPAQQREISLWTMKDSFQGSMLSANEATRTYTSRTKWLYMVSTGIFFVLGCGVALLAAPSDQPAIYIAVLVLTLLIVACQVFLLRRRTRVWNARLSRRVADLAPSSGKIGFDTTGLGVGDRVLPWNTLAIQQVDFIRHSIGQTGGRRATMYIIERLSLTSPSGAVVLDTAMMGSGRLIVDNIWRRLVAAPTPA
jgi:hypothetical protein